MLTGDRPTGKLHIGHYVGSLRQRLEIQKDPEFDKMFIMIADAQALTDNAENPQKVRESVMQVAMDYLAIGIDPSKTSIMIQSLVPQLHELTMYYMNLVTVSRVQRNPTIKSEIQMRGFGDNIPMGFFNYPVSQASDITAFRATTVPAGEDQEPMIELTREIVGRFNNVYGETLVEPEILLPTNAACLRLPGTDGKAKMSKSLGNCIYLSDTSKDVAKKVKGMYTDPLHLNISDPGHLEGNCPFIYLDAFCTDEKFKRHCSEFESLQDLKDRYCAGGVGDGTVKKILISVLEEELAPIRERRKQWEQDIPGVFEILRRGSEEARAVAAETLADVRRAMRINYFDDPKLIAEQAAKYAGK